MEQEREPNQLESSQSIEVSQYLTLGTHARFTVVAVSVCVCVCLSVKRHLTSGASVCPENAVTYSAGNEGQNICGVFSKTHAFQRSRALFLGWPYIRSAIFPVDNMHAHCAYASCRVRDRCSMM